MTEKLSSEKTRFSENFKRINDKIGETKARLGITSDITVMGATKTVSAEIIKYARSQGLTDAGENRVQELNEKFAEGAYDGMKLHFVGRLQTNKVKYLAEKNCDILIQSLDSISLAKEIEKRYSAVNRVCTVLVELNSGAEDAKGGVSAEDIGDFFDLISDYKHIKPMGIMNVAPFCQKKDDYRKYFDKTFQIFIDISAKKLHNICRPILSMGMSDNYDLAVEYGATLVRPGRALFGDRA